MLRHESTGGQWTCARYRMATLTAIVIRIILSSRTRFVIFIGRRERLQRLPWNEVLRPGSDELRDECWGARFQWNELRQQKMVSVGQMCLQPPRTAKTRSAKRSPRVLLSRRCFALLSVCWSVHCGQTVPVRHMVSYRMRIGIWGRHFDWVHF